MFDFLELLYKMTLWPFPQKREKKWEQVLMEHFQLGRAQGYDERSRRGDLHWCPSTHGKCFFLLALHRILTVGLKLTAAVFRDGDVWVLKTDSNETNRVFVRE